MRASDVCRIDANPDDVHTALIELLQAPLKTP